MQLPTIVKLSIGILKESLLHPKAVLILDRESGKVTLGKKASDSADG